MLTTTSTIAMFFVVMLEPCHDMATDLLSGCRAMLERMPPHSHTSFCSGSLSKRPPVRKSVK